MSPEGKKIVVDTKADPCLFSAPVNPPNTGTKYTRGKDLYYHKARSGKEYFYFHSWSMWQGEEDSLRLADRQEAESFLIEKAGNSGWDSLSEKEIEDLKEYGFDLLREDA